jgi:hypothetical protein
VRWKVKVSGAVKSGLALADGKLYFGDYSGRVYAIRQADGSRAWTASTHGSRFGLGSGNFYSTPAVAYGRVYIGSTDGNVYSFASSNGKLAWRKGTGGYVYGSPAVAQVPGGKPTVYIGSYSRRFYALDARSGGVIWSIHSGGRVSGGATVIGDIVYFSELDGKRTVGVGARTGRHVFEFGRGAYNPVVSDGRWIFLTGYSSLYALRPLSAEGKQTMAKRARVARRTKVESRRAAQRREADVRSTCRARAARLHDRHGARIRSFRRCVPSLRHFRTRRACVRRAEATHKRRSEIVRSARRCVRRNS